MAAAFFLFLLAFILSCIVSGAFFIGGPGGDLEHHFISDSTIDWLQKMATSYLIERGEPLIEVLEREGSCAGDNACGERDDDVRLRLARTCATTNLAIGSHDFLRSDEAIYCYGNKSFLNGFGYDWTEFVELPSRKCVASGECKLTSITPYSAQLNILRRRRC